MADEELKKLLEDPEIYKLKYFVAFLDILGFKEYVKTCIDNKNIEDLIKSGSILEETISNVIELPKNQIDFIKNNMEYNQFSDCIYMAIPYIEGDNKSFIYAFAVLITMLRTYQSKMFMGNFYVRGGLSSGFHLETPKIVFSEGLINAHKLESEKAIYPRIILDDCVVKTIEEMFNVEKDLILRYGLDKMLLSDMDDIIFINPFSWTSTDVKSAEDKEIFKKSIKDFCDSFGLEMPEEIENIDVNNFLDIVNTNILSIVYQNVENKIKELEDGNKDDEIKQHILKKYMWLQELVKWSLDPDRSKIKFEYYLKV